MINGNVMKYVIWLGVVILFLYVYIKNERKSKYYNIAIVEKQKKIDSLKNLADSLDIENYPCQIELNRYQTAYEIFSKRNPKAASQYGDIISDETE